MKNEKTTKKVSLSEREIAISLRSRVTSSQNVVSTNPLQTNSVNYTLPELSEEGENRRTRRASCDDSVEVISSGISDLKLSPTQVSHAYYFLPLYSILSFSSIDDSCLNLIYLLTVTTTSISINISVSNS